MIDSTDHNNLVSDILTMLTDSLSRTGAGGLLAALRGIDGTVSAPALSFTSETGTGLYRISASDLGLAISGTKRLEVTGTKTLVVDALVVGASAVVASPGDLGVARTSAPTEGYLYMGNANTHYLGFDGTKFAFTDPLSAPGVAVVAFRGNGTGAIAAQTGSVTASAATHPSAGVWTYTVAGVTSNLVAIVTCHAAGYAPTVQYSAPNTIAVTAGSANDVAHTVVIFKL